MANEVTPAGTVKVPLDVNVCVVAAATPGAAATAPAAPTSAAADRAQIDVRAIAHDAAIVRIVLASPPSVNPARAPGARVRRRLERTPKARSRRAESTPTGSGTPRG
jgi:hypothetical protein